MEIINRYITFVTFIPWLLIFTTSIINNLNNKNWTQFSWKYFKQNFFKIFRLDTLILVIAFYYFASFDKEFVDKYLFAVICIYMFVNSFYEERKRLKKGFFKNNWLTLALISLIMLIPFLVYYIKNNLIFTYKIMLLYLFLEYIIIMMCSYISKIIFKLTIKK